MEKIKPSFIPAIAWAIISTILLTLPGSTLPKANWLDEIWFDKWVHISMFAIMVILWCRALLKKNYPPKALRNIFTGMALLWIAYGTGMEFVQKYFIPGRSFELADIAADSTGSILGLIYSIRRFIKK